MNQLIRRLTSGAIGFGFAGALALAGAPPSQAASPTTTRVPAALDDIKRDGAKAIADREAQLTKLAGRLSSAPNCDAGGKIAGEIASDGPALTTLGNKLASAATVVEARNDYKSIFDDYRIYLVVTPQAYVASACGHITQAAATLTKDESTLMTRVRAAEAGGADMSDAKAVLNDMTSQLADAATAGNRASATLTAINPDHGDKSIEASNKTAVENAKHDLDSAQANLTAALNDAHRVVADLKSVK